jgi:Zn-dependent protease
VDPTPLARHRRIPIRPSPVFLALVALAAGSGAYVWTRPAAIVLPMGATAMRVGVFVFVAVVWVITLSLHEFMHAVIAWYGGDHSVDARGYLTLDPRRYMNQQLSIVLPIIIVLMGGIGLPGGAVMIDRRLIPSPWRRSLVSAAGPFTNAACSLACILPLRLHWVTASHQPFEDALAFLALLQVAVTILNSLPIPGLDGFGVLAPHLPDETVARLMPISRYVFLGLFLLLLTSVRAGSAFYNLLFHTMSGLGVNRSLAEDGQILFTFWRKLQ